MLDSEVVQQADEKSLKDDPNSESPLPETNSETSPKHNDPPVVDGDKVYEEVKGFLNELQEALSTGQLKLALSLFEKCQYRIKKLSSVNYNPKRLEKISRSLRDHQRSLRELKGWRHWSMDQVRKELIVKVENLAKSNYDPRGLAEQIRIARDQWQKWNKTGDFPNKTLRRQFENACKQAYAPCKEFFEHQNEQRKQNLAARNEICDSLEKLFEEIDWKNPDWKATGAKIQNARKLWRKSVPLHKLDWNQTNSRLDAVMLKFEPYLSKEREKGIKTRNALIDQVNSLDSSPLESALETVKRLQREWNKVTIRGDNKTEAKLWDEFRSACDRQFDRRRAKQQEIKKQASETVKNQKAILTKIEKLNDMPVEQLAELAPSISKLEQEWKNTAPPRARKVPKKLDSKFESQLSKIQAGLELAAHKQSMATLLSLESKANLCTELENSIGDENALETLDKIQSEWETLSESCGQYDKLIQERFDAASTAIKDGNRKNEVTESNVQQNLHLKKEICLLLEILAEVESPPEFANDRMRLRVERLNAVMAKQVAAEETQNQCKELMTKFLLTGPVPKDDYKQLHNRFERVRKELENRA